MSTAKSKAYVIRENKGGGVDYSIPELIKNRTVVDHFKMVDEWVKQKRQEEETNGKSD